MNNPIDEPVSKKKCEIVVKVQLLNSAIILQSDQIENTPSSVHHLSKQYEDALRTYSCELIQDAINLLNLPQVASATAQVLFQRFYYSRSFVNHFYEYYAMGCVLLASKIEEAPARNRNIVNVFRYLRQTREKKSLTAIPVNEYIAIKTTMIKAERKILKALGFNVHGEHPHKLFIMLLKILSLTEEKQLSQLAWNYMNDSFRTNVFLCYYPETVACACVFLSARELGIPLPQNWLELFNISIESVEAVSKTILKLHTQKRPPLLEIEKKLNELRALLNKSANPNATETAVNGAADHQQQQMNTTSPEAPLSRSVGDCERSVSVEKRRAECPPRITTQFMDTNVTTNGNLTITTITATVPSSSAATTANEKPAHNISNMTDRSPKHDSSKSVNNNYHFASNIANKQQQQKHHQSGDGFPPFATSTDTIATMTASVSKNATAVSASSEERSKDRKTKEENSTNTQRSRKNSSSNDSRHHSRKRKHRSRSRHHRHRHHHREHRDEQSDRTDHHERHHRHHNHHHHLSSNNSNSHHTNSHKSTKLHS